MINSLFVLGGIVIFLSSFLSGGLVFYVPFYGYVAWFIGLILVALGLWRNEKEKRRT